MKGKYDFSGWATKNNLRCSDGRIIMQDAFKDNDGGKVPLVWNHQHNNPNNVLGHAILENRDEGVYAYCTFNGTTAGKNAKEYVQHGDVCALSIWANGLQQDGSQVLHGVIREVSLVLAGANPGAYIDTVMRHGEEFDDEAIIYTGEPLYLEHSDDADEHDGVDENGEGAKEEEKKEETPEEEPKEKTVGDVIKSMNQEQQDVLYGLVAKAMSEKEDKSEDESMKHNVFDNNEIEDENDVLTHDEFIQIVSEAKNGKSLKETFLAHGINQLDYLFPDAKNLNNEPIFVQRDMEWVNSVMGGVKHTPFSRVKSIFANITMDEARAKGYIKGNRKEEEVFALLKRTTEPKTVYKKQQFDRDDIIDITDIDVIAWVKKEMRMMLDEEIARAILVGDGRSTLSADKIDETKVRPIWKDDDFFTVKYPIVVAANATDAAKAKAFIRAAIKSRKLYKGSGNPVMFMTEDMLTECLLLEDLNQRIIYDTEEKLRVALRVSKIVTVPVLEGLSRMVGTKNHELAGIYVNLSDYNVGADKGGAVNMFDDFDIDYNQYKYLIETRFSGALIKPFAAVALEFCEGAPVTLTVAPMDKDATVLGKKVSELQHHVTVFEDEISGYLNYVTGYTGFSETTSEQSGNYLALKFAIPTGASATVEILGGVSGPVTLDSDLIWVGKIANNGQSIKVVVTGSDSDTLERIYTLKGLTLKSA